jgi:hypothetical protein
MNKSINEAITSITHYKSINEAVTSITHYKSINKAIKSLLLSNGIVG